MKTASAERRQRDRWMSVTMLALSPTPCWILTVAAIELLHRGETGDELRSTELRSVGMFVSVCVDGKKENRKFPPLLLLFFGFGVLFIAAPVASSVFLSVPVFVSSPALTAITVFASTASPAGPAAAPAAGSAMTGTRPTYTHAQTHTYPGTHRK